MRSVMLTRLSLGWALVALAACGGSSSDPAAPQLAGELAEQQRALPGYQLALRQDGAAVPGQPVALQLRVTPQLGAGQPAVVEAAVSVAEPTQWYSASAGANGEQQWSLAVPEQPGVARAWIRITDAAGNQSQTGLWDFALR
ncbi:MAG: hypothetical protein PF961_03330 [Planctomycetota bacterium]|jgi:hypothetical protein|nr:hypothetical protein [Planctomycetota bacterium]